MDLVGKKFGRLTVTKRSHSSGGNVFWVCLCDCGETKVTKSGFLNSGTTKSCGCLFYETTVLNGKNRKKHGLRSVPEYYVWSQIKDRCYNKNRDGWKNYGGRGITVCDRWLNSFENFIEDMGFRPQGTSIDRINNNGNYEPSNCRWATPRQQVANRSNTLPKNVREIIHLISESQNITYNAAYNKLRRAAQCLKINS